MKEANIVRRIMVRVSRGASRLFRVNVGQVWAGRKAIEIRYDGVISVEAGDVLLKAGHRFRTGVPNGYPDLTGFNSVVIKPDMVGMKVAVFAAIEVKTKIGRTSSIQKSFLDMVQSMGGIAGVARSEDEAQQILENWYKAK